MQHLWLIPTNPLAQLGYRRAMPAFASNLFDTEDDGRSGEEALKFGQVEFQTPMARILSLAGTPHRAVGCGRLNICQSEKVCGVSGRVPDAGSKRQCTGIRINSHLMKMS